jgi:hypothetical protein
VREGDDLRTYSLKLDAAFDEAVRRSEQTEQNYRVNVFERFGAPEP